MFQPERDEFDFLMNRQLLADMGIRFWRFRSQTPVARDPERMTQMVENLLRANPSTLADKPDAAKQKTGPEGEADQDTKAKDDKTEKPTAADDASSKLGAQLEALTAELRTLNTTVKAQQQRLARLEKRSGLPNSRSTGEQPAKSTNDDDVGWPLDMNRSLDRESVDKSTSFHDV